MASVDESTVVYQSTDGSVGDTKSDLQKPMTSNGQQLPPPLVLPDSPGDDPLFISRLKYFTATSHCHRWTKNMKNVSQNGFHQLWWSAILSEPSIMTLIKQIFGDNIVYISDDQYKKYFGIKLDTSANISDHQLKANHFLLFIIAGKSDVKYLEEWTKRRIRGYGAVMYIRYPTYGLELKCGEFVVRPELFATTKQVMYSYNKLIYHLICHSFNKTSSEDLAVRDFYRFVLMANEYSGLKWFKLSLKYADDCHSKALIISSVVEDIHKIRAAKSAFIEKYSENLLPFARLLDLPEAESFNQRHYPDLAVCAHQHYTSLESTGLYKQIKFQPLKTRTPIEELRRYATPSIPYCIDIIEKQEIIKELDQIRKRLEKLGIACDNSLVDQNIAKFDNLIKQFPIFSKVSLVDKTETSDKLLVSLMDNMTFDEQIEDIYDFNESLDYDYNDDDFF